jgi:hypothetical protein
MLDYWIVDPLLSTLKQARRTARRKNTQPLAAAGTTQPKG